MKTVMPQNYANHRTYDWAHIAATLLLALATLTALVLFLPCITDDTAMFLMKAVLFCYGLCGLIIAMKTRRYPLKLQDRIIRTEMRLRLEKLLPPDEHWQITGLDNNQLVALRFASDEELPDLMRKALNEGLSNRDQLKRMVRQWTPDHDRI